MVASCWDVFSYKLKSKAAAVQAVEAETFVFAAPAGSSKALGKGWVRLQECLAGRRSPVASASLSVSNKCKSFCKKLGM